jgi:hypothetical protein
LYFLLTKKIEKLNAEKEGIQNHVIKITKDALRFADKETAGQAKEVIGQKIKLPADDKRLIEDSIKPDSEKGFLEKMQSPRKQFSGNKEDITKAGPPKAF